MLEGCKFSIWTDHKPLTDALYRTSDPWTPQQCILHILAIFTTDTASSAWSTTSVSLRAFSCKSTLWALGCCQTGRQVWIHYSFLSQFSQRLLWAVGLYRYNRESPDLFFNSHCHQVPFLEAVACHDGWDKCTLQPLCRLTSPSDFGSQQKQVFQPFMAWSIQTPEQHRSCRLEWYGKAGALIFQNRWRSVRLVVGARFLLSQPLPFNS